MLATVSSESCTKVATFADDFVRTVTAQASLMEILLRLNSGLFGIITSFVHSDKDNVQLDYNGLTDLSERCRIDTCRTLRNLVKRMSQLRLPKPAPERAEPQKRIEERPSTAENARRKASPLSYSGARDGLTLARVVIKDSSKPSQIALVKPSEKRKKSHASSSSGGSNLSSNKATSRSHSRAASSTPSTATTTPPPSYTSHDSPRPKPQRTQTAPTNHKPHRKHSSPNVALPALPTTKESLRTTKSTPRLQTTPHKSESTPRLNQPPPPPVPRFPSITDLPLRQRKPTPTFYSIASDSTKLGEIPLHKWAVPPDFDEMSLLNREAERLEWPVTSPLGGQQDEGGERRWGWGLGRLFGRRGGG